MMSALNVRAQFAKRLKDIRVQRGFDRARYFAKSLGIEENRYTRYERAEVEPSLSLIQKICETLRVTPNELLGYANLRLEGAGAPSPILLDAAGEAGPDGAKAYPVGSSHPNAPGSPGALAWRLAVEAIGLRRPRDPTNNTGADALARFRETAALFQQLRSAPFDTVAEILSDPSLHGAGAGREAALAQLIKSYTDSASKTPAPAAASRSAV
jgi:transcriptional regulator with XRE-family HTH domain